VFCDDSIVRGTQLTDQVHRLYDDGASEIHMRIACPPLLFVCPFLNFSRPRKEIDLAGRKIIKELEGDAADINAYCDPDGKPYAMMVERVRKRFGLASLRYQRLDDLLAAIGIPAHKICTYCWSGKDITLCGRKKGQTA
jgi:amidophosphoribosyltransferase